MVATLLAAQAARGNAQIYRVAQAENFRQEPGSEAKRLATVMRGVQVRGGELRNGWLEVTMEGWIFGQSVSATTRDGFDLVVSSAGGERLRNAPNGSVMARLEDGFLLKRMGEEGEWVRVSRTGWMWAKSLDSADPTAGAASTAGTPEAERGLIAKSTALYGTPSGSVLGTLAPETSVRVITRSGEWVRVQTDGWIKEADLKPGGGILVGVSGSEVRTRPKEFEGRLVQWEVQLIALPAANELRPDIPSGKRYLLARGPLPEAGFIYVILLPEQVAEAQRLPPLARLVIVAKVLTGRSQYVGNPVVELVRMTTKESIQ